MGDILHLEMKIDAKTALDDITTILTQVRPQWDTTKVEIQDLEGGIQNKNWKAFLRSSPEDALVVKKYGEGSEKFIDREREFKVITVMHSEKVIQPVLCRFLNGYVYQFAPGGTLTPSKHTNPYIYRQVIEKLHKIHAIDINKKAGETIKDIILDLAERNKAFTSNADFHRLDTLEWYSASFPNTETLVKELDEAHEVYKHLRNESDIPTVLCHGTPHMLNIVYDEKEEKISLIDYETTGFCSEIRDVACYICIDTTMQFEALGIEIETCDDFILQFTKDYLSTHPLYNGDISEDLVDKWLKAIYEGIYVCCFVGVPWALQQYFWKNIDFDYASLAISLYRKGKFAREKAQALNAS